MSGPLRPGSSGKFLILDPRLIYGCLDGAGVIPEPEPELELELTLAVC